MTRTPAARLPGGTHRFFDDYLLTAARSAGRRQVVLLGAGLDARARPDWPTGVHVFEVEDPAVLAFKERVLTCRFPADAALSSERRHRRPEGGTQAGFDPGRPTAWLCEALCTSAPEVEAVVAVMTELLRARQ